MYTVLQYGHENHYYYIFTMLAVFFNFPIGDVCPSDKQLATCLINPCILSFCPHYPNAKCFSNYCGGCNSVFYDENDRDVTDLCGMYMSWLLYLVHALLIIHSSVS